MTDTMIYNKFKLKMVIDNKIVGGFSEAMMPEIPIERIEYRECIVSPVKAQSAPPKQGDITFQRGVTISLDFLAWLQNSNNEPKTIQIQIWNSEDKPVAEWTIANATPVFYKIGSYIQISDGVPIEEIIFRHEKLTLTMH